MRVNGTCKSLFYEKLNWLEINLLIDCNLLKVLCMAFVKTRLDVLQSD